MSRLFLVRHGPTHAKTMVGWSDLPADLSDTAALARLEEHLPSDALVVSSDLSRAIHTADAIQGKRRRLPHVAGLREMHFGDWELKSYKDIDDQDHSRAFWETPGDIAAPNGESWNQLCQRVDTSIGQLLTAHPNKDLVVVAHFGVVITQIQKAMKVSAYQAFGHKIDNLSVTEVSLQGEWGVNYINHLP